MPECLKCESMCKTCEIKENNCTECKSTTRTSSNCKCKDGYRDIGEFDCEECAW